MKSEKKEPMSECKVAVKWPYFDELPEYCDDCPYYAEEPNPFNGWATRCGLCNHFLDDNQKDEGWIYDGKTRPKKCPLVSLKQEGDETQNVGMSPGLKEERHKDSLVAKLRDLLQDTRQGAGLDDLEYRSYENGNEFVHVKWDSGKRYDINVRGDTDIQIISDVIRRISRGD